MKKIALFMIAFLAFAPVLSCVAETERSAEITSPEAGEEVYGEVEFTATLTDDDEDGLNWAVRKGTCKLGVVPVLGNVEGHHDTYEWSDGKFSATADTTTWEKGSYCFVFNPIEDVGESDIRLERWFEVVDEPEDETAPEVEIIDPEDGDVLEDTVEIYGTATDDNLKSYILTIKDHEGNVVETVEDDDADSFTGELLLTWDTTAVDNGMYTIILEAEDEAGNVGSDEISVKVENKLHLENKNQCKNGGWRELGFKNQGRCVSYLQSNEHAGKRQ